VHIDWIDNPRQQSEVQNPLALVKQIYWPVPDFANGQIKYLLIIVDCQSCVMFQ
jgi:hypothetical protein